MKQEEKRNYTSEELYSILKENKKLIDDEFLKFRQSGRKSKEFIYAIQVLFESGLYSDDSSSEDFKLLIYNHKYEFIWVLLEFAISYYMLYHDVEDVNKDDLRIISSSEEDSLPKLVTIAVAKIIANEIIGVNEAINLVERNTRYRNALITFFINKRYESDEMRKRLDETPNEFLNESKKIIINKTTLNDEIAKRVEKTHLGFMPHKKNKPLTRILEEKNKPQNI